MDAVERAFADRPLRNGELLAYLPFKPQFFGDEVLGRERALEAWRILAKEPGFVAAAVTADPPIPGVPLMGLGAAVFVTGEFAEQELREPRPGQNARILESIASGKPVTAGVSALAAGNARGGLSLVNLIGGPRRDVLNLEDQLRTSVQLGLALNRALAGWRVKRYFNEATSAIECERLENTHSVRKVAAFGEARALYEYTATHVNSVHMGHSLSAAFQFTHPRLRLKPGAQRMLLAAIDGRTDSELARELNLTVASVKKGWLDVFDSVREHMPGLLPGGEVSEGSAAAPGRGPQKRHLLLSYLRAHPEELTPYDWDLAARHRPAR